MHKRLTKRRVGESYLLAERRPCSQRVLLTTSYNQPLRASDLKLWQRGNYRVQACFHVRGHHYDSCFINFEDATSLIE